MYSYEYGGAQVDSGYQGEFVQVLGAFALRKVVSMTLK